MPSGNQKICFVLMPFRPELKTVYTEAIKTACEKAGFKAVRADELIGPYNIHRDIIEYIFSSEAVIADLTDWNPNVFYELGVAHAIANKTVMIVQAGQKLPFDIHNYRCISYEASETGLLSLTHQIAEYLEHLEEWSGRPTNPVQEFKRHDPLAESTEVERLRRELRQKEERLKASAPKAELEKLRREYQNVQRELSAKEQSSVAKVEWQKLKEQLQVKAAENAKLEKEIARWRKEASSAKEKAEARAVAQIDQAQGKPSQWHRFAVVAIVAMVLGVFLGQLFLPERNQLVRLRSQAKTLSEAEVKAMLRGKDFFCADYGWNKAWSNPQGKGLDNLFELQANGEIVFDQRTDLAWQQAGSKDSMTLAKAEEYVGGLNTRRFAGYTDWRLPTLEEAMSLIEREGKSGGLYLDNKFARAQRWIWTADKPGPGRAWVVYFVDGYCNPLVVGNSNHVRAVR